MVREDADFSRRLKLASPVDLSQTRDHYEILTAKRRLNDYLANRALIHLANPDGKVIDILIQVSNDGVGYRYGFPEKSAVLHKMKAETSSFHFLMDTQAWLQPMSPAKSGWAEKPARDAKPAEPGKASWSWPLMGDAKTVFAVQKDFIDYAANMGWRYTLIDAQWDQQIGDAKIKQLVDYGHYVVIARKAKGRWFVAGINSGSVEQKLRLDLSKLAVSTGSLITDGNGGNLTFDQMPLKLSGDKMLEITLKPAGGCVLTLDP